MRCKCINNRLDHLTMEMNKVKHAIDAILDTPQRSAPPTQTGASATRDAASSSQRGPSGVASSQQRGTSSSRSPVPPNLRGASSSQGVASSRDKEEDFPPLPSQTSTNKRGPPQPAPPGETQPAPPGVTHFVPHGTTLPVNPRATVPPFAHQPRRINNFPPFPAHYHDDVYLFQSHSSPRRGGFTMSQTGPPMNYAQRPSHPPRPPQLAFDPTLYGQRYPPKTYASAVSTPPSYTRRGHGCENCGEPNHRAQNCRHGMQIQCRRCFVFGHKAKSCIY